MAFQHSGCFLQGSGGELVRYVFLGEKRDVAGFLDPFVRDLAVRVGASPELPGEHVLGVQAGGLVEAVVEGKGLGRIAGNGAGLGPLEQVDAEARGLAEGVGPGPVDSLQVGLLGRGGVAVVIIDDALDVDPGRRDLRSSGVRGRQGVLGGAPRGQGEYAEALPWSMGVSRDAVWAVQCPGYVSKAYE